MAKIGTGKFEHIAATAKIACVILGYSDTSDFELHDLRDCKTTFRFGARLVGVFGVTETREGLQAQSAFNEALAPDTVSTLAAAFVEYVARKLFIAGAAKAGLQN
jgi:hypothetical protein